MSRLKLMLNWNISGLLRLSKLSRSHPRCPRGNFDKWFLLCFAAPVIGNNRFRAPQSLNDSWTGVRNATNLGPACPALFRSALWTLEDCLNLQIYRPAAVTKHARLPVMVYFYGGGGLSGSASDPRYNMTTMVSQGAKVGKPFIAVVPQYRMRHYGTLASSELLWEDATNIVIRDNRMTLLWLRENIKSFGGDPQKVTLMGQSYGGIIASYQMLLNDGDNDSLFRAAILASGSPTASSFGDIGAGQQGFNYLVNATGCFDTVDRLACMRAAKFSTIYRAFANATIDTPVSPGVPVIDGLTIKRLPSDSLKMGLYSKVPVLIGGCRDEGTSFVTAVANDTASLSSQWLNNALTLVGVGWANFPKPPLMLPSTWSRLLEMYPDVPSAGAPFNGLDITPPAYPLGLEFRRSAAIAGDIGLEQGKRFATKIFSQDGLPLYVYQWGTVSSSVSNATLGRFIGVSHGSDTLSMFLNKDPTISNPLGTSTEIVDQATRFSSSLASFIHDLTPNNHGFPDMPQWPLYTTKAGKKMLYFNATDTSYKISTISDGARQANMEFMWSIYKELRT
ncbi:Alpha/Beta hydrolase protein [Bisporella sp. PMI_857]|nr:Alpha/Beta hydrolase protein [Bisporella sp. PMI_857]